MKKFLMTLAVACFALTASAQEKGDLRFGVTAGMNVSNITDMEMDSRIGFHVGAKAEYNITDNLYGSAALLFSQKGATKEHGYAEGGYTETSKLSCNPGYLQLPIHIGYRYKVGEKVSIFGETGPYFAYGICGKAKDEWTETYAGITESGEDKEDFFGDDKKEDNYGAKRFDCGWGVKVGVEAAKFQVSLGYEYGFTKVKDINDAFEGSKKPHNSNFMVSVAYMF